MYGRLSVSLQLWRSLDTQCSEELHKEATGMCVCVNVVSESQHERDRARTLRPWLKRRGTAGAFRSASSLVRAPRDRITVLFAV